MKKLIPLLILSLISVGGCSRQIELDSPSYILTTKELREQSIRQEKLDIYSHYLGSIGLEIADTPFDVIQQMVYDSFTDKEQVYSITLYRNPERLEVNTFADLHSLDKAMEYRHIDETSTLPNVLKEYLHYGYHTVQMDGEYYVAEVKYETVDLLDWEISYSKVLQLGGGTNVIE